MIDFKKSLRKFHHLALDTMCFTYYFEEKPRYYHLCGEIFELMEKGKIECNTSLLAYTEILVKPKKRKDIEMENLYREIFHELPNLKIINFNWEVAEITAELRAKYNLKLPDLIHISSAISSGAEIFITNDRKLTQIKEIPILILRDYV